MKKCFFFMQGILLPILFCSAQKPVTRPLDIGDKVPDITFHNIINYKSRSAKLSDLKGKLVIFDFWTIHCGGCIATFPHLDSLQKIFGKNLQLFLVSTKAGGDDEAKIKLFFEKRKIRTGREEAFSIIVNDTILDRMFPPISIPHYAWIDGKGVVKAITGQDDVTLANIQSILKNEKISLHTKKNKVEFDRQKPLFVAGNIGEGQADLFLGRSILTGWKEGDLPGAGQRRNSKNEIIGFFMFNQSLYTLLGNAYSSGYSFQKNSVLIEINDSLKIEPPAGKEAYKHLYCYDLAVPPTSFENLQRYIREDIERYFHIRLTKEIRKVKCLVITSTDKLEKSSIKAEGPQAVLESLSLHKYMHDYPIPQVIQVLNTWSGMLLIDETGLSDDIDIELPFDLSDTRAIIQALQNTGFAVSEQERDAEVTVVSDTKN